MGTGPAGSQPRPLDLLKIGWSIKQLQTTLIPAGCLADTKGPKEAISCTNYTSNNNCGKHTWFKSKSVPWAHLGAKVLAPHSPNTGTYTPTLTLTSKNMLPPWGSSNPLGKILKNSHTLQRVQCLLRWWEDKEKDLPNPLPGHFPFSMTVLINWIISELCMCALTLKFKQQLQRVPWSLINSNEGWTEIQMWPKNGF